MATKEIPYGLSDYARLALENYYYVDKTHFIPLIEKAASFFFLIRPRRFGKSLTLSMLESYYDINNANRFEELFGERWIYQHPTALRAKFLILRFNFSAVSSNIDRMLDSFEEHCKDRFIDFADRYEHLFAPGFRQELMERETAASGLSYINTKASFLKLNLYLIIDEYDNFTNTILSTYGTEAYQKATHGEGFFRFFFNVIKAATTGSEQALKRMFITGVSPITLDDVTSGFNIGSNFTTDPQFNGIVGFSETELRTMLTYYKEEGTLKAEVEDLITMMKPWYDNYCFAEETLDESMFNSDMVLYFLSTFLRLGTPPKEMIDRNIRTDYNKIRHLIRIDRELGANFSIIREIVENGRTTANINSSFPADRMVDTNNFTVQTSPRTFEAVTYLRRSSNDISRIRKRFRCDPEEYMTRAQAISNAKVFADYYAITTVPSNATGNIPVIGAKVANSLLEMKNIKASFVLSEYKSRIQISARSIDDANVQLIMEKLGGGGHSTVAAAQLDMSLSEAVAALKEVITNMIKEGDLK